MAIVDVNPEAEASANFDIAAPGVYRMRIEGSPNMPAVTIQNSKTTPGNVCLRIRAVFVEPTAVNREDGTPAKLLGSIIDNSLLISPRDKQGKLRSMVEATGLPWLNFDENDLVGREFLAKVEIELYKGDKKNVIKRYLLKG